MGELLVAELLLLERDSAPLRWKSSFGFQLHPVHPHWLGNVLDRLLP